MRKEVEWGERPPKSIRIGSITTHKWMGYTGPTGLPASMGIDETKQSLTKLLFFLYRIVLVRVPVFLRWHKSKSLTLFILHYTSTWYILLRTNPFIRCLCHLVYERYTHTHARTLSSLLHDQQQSEHARHRTAFVPDARSITRAVHNTDRHLLSLPSLHTAAVTYLLPGHVTATHLFIIPSNTQIIHSNRTSTPLLLPRVHVKPS